MGVLQIEKLGGLANFGGVRSRVRSRGEIHTSVLSAEDQKTVDELFTKTATAGAATADGFRYRISRTTQLGTEFVEVPEDELPTSLVRCVKDEFVE